MLQMHRQRAEIGLLAFQDDLLHRRVARRDLDRLDRVVEPLRDDRKKSRFVGVERNCEAFAGAHDVADQLGLFRTHRLEPGGFRITVQHGGHVDQIDRLVVDLTFAKLHQPFDEAAQAKTFGVNSGHSRLPGSRRGSCSTLRRQE